MSKPLKNKKEDYYDERKIVMEFIYEAIELMGKRMPRVEVKICHDRDFILGQGFFGKEKINIAEATFKLSKGDIRSVVYHELVHTWFKYSGHDESCLLMSSSLKTGLTKAQVQKLFKKYIKEENVQSVMAA
jgi:hypothetical protein